MIHSIYLSVKIVRYTLKNNHEKTNLSSNLSFISTGIYAQMKDLVQYVNTLQGTDSHLD